MLVQAPFSFQLSLPAPRLPSAPLAFHSSASRRLLDIEKLTLATDAERRVLRDGAAAVQADTQSVLLTVSWSGRAPSPSAEAALRAAGVEFIIVCDTLLAPGVPRFVPALLGLLALALLLALRYALPLVLRHARAVEVEAHSELSKRR